MAKRIIICCPTSLVNNWDSECIKWLKVLYSMPMMLDSCCVPGFERCKC